MSEHLEDFKDIHRISYVFEIGDVDEDDCDLFSGDAKLRLLPYMKKSLALYLGRSTIQQ